MDHDSAGQTNGAGHTECAALSDKKKKTEVDGCEMFIADRYMGECYTPLRHSSTD